jgi:hypothetical protein
MRMTAEIRWIIPAAWNPPSAWARRLAHADSLNRSGRPLTASPRKLTMSAT